MFLLNYLNYLLFADAGGAGEGADDVEALKSANAKLQKSYDRVVNESTSYKSRAQSAEAELSDVEKKIAEKSGDLQKQYDLEAKEHTGTKGKLKDITSKAIANNLRVEALKIGKDAHDIDVILNVEKHQHLLKVDSDNLKVEGVEDFMKAVRGSHSYLFTKSKLLNTDTTTPKDKIDNKDLSDRQLYSKELKACKDFAALETCKEKWSGKKTWIK